MRHTIAEYTGRFRAALRPPAKVSAGDKVRIPKLAPVDARELDGFTSLLSAARLRLEYERETRQSEWYTLVRIEGAR